jgi:hypothetical protein
MEKEKIIAVVDDINPLKRNLELRNKIQMEIIEAKKALAKIFHENSKVIPNNFPLPDIRVKDILVKEHVTCISNNIEKQKYRIVIFQKDIPNDADFDWIPKNGIRFVLEYIVSDEKLQWKESTNHYSAKVVGKVTDLKELLLDVFVDILIEGSLSKSKQFKKDFQNKNFTNQINTKEKCCFIKKMKNISLNDNLNYYPFSSLFKSSSNNSFDYNIHAILTFWQEYLLYLTGDLEKLPKVSNLSDLIELIPKKYQGQINHGQLESMFINKCATNGLFEFIWLRKSPIGATERVKRQLETVFTGKPRIGSSTIIPFAFSHSINGIEHLVIVIKFQKQ